MRLSCAATAALITVLAGGSALARRADDPSLQRVSSHLRAARTQLLQHRAPAETLARVADDGFAAIELRFNSLDPATVEQIRAIGARIDHVSYRYGRVL